jgi:hypothetical protein
MVDEAGNTVHRHTPRCLVHKVEVCNKVRLRLYRKSPFHFGFALFHPSGAQSRQRVVVLCIVPCIETLLCVASEQAGNLVRLIPIVGPCFLIAECFIVLCVALCIDFFVEDGSTRVQDESQNAFLYADLGGVTAATINQLRQAFQIQKLLEKDARGGTRYREVLREHFGVISPDSRMQIPEYLGGYRLPINVSQVIQTSSSDDTSPLGNTAALSVTTMNKPMFTKSFTEHGFIMGLAVVRTDQTYQQGIERMWSRKGRYDYYWPVLANIGEQAILNKEIYAQGNAKDDEAFGYQEAWADYRYKPSKVTGLFRSNAQQSLDAWHYAQDYDALPTLSTTWMEQGETEMKRTLAVQNQPDFIADFYFMNKTTRCMPVYSIPGLIDHH